MEAIVTFILIDITFLVIVYSVLICGRSRNKNEIEDYQKILDESDADAHINYGLEWKHDAATELAKQRKQKKALVLIFSGILIAMVSIILACTTTFLSLLNVEIACISSIVLILFGIIIVSESKKLAIGILLLVIVMGTIIMFVFDKLMTMSPYAYFYFCGLILLIALATLIPRTNK